MTRSRALSLAAAAFGLSLMGVPTAHAFTLDNQSNTSSVGTARYSDPDEHFSNDGSRKTTIQNGNATLQFGGQTQSFDQRYDQNRLFDPLSRDR